LCTAKKIVEVIGDNCLLSGKKGGLHPNVRKDFVYTETVIVRRYDNISEAPKATREIRKYMCYCRASSDSIMRVRRERVEESAAMKPEDPDLAGVAQMK